MEDIGEHDLEGDGRKVHVPLSEIVECCICRKPAKEAKLRVCNACGEVLYCSTECQQKDWKTHKLRCGKTDRIDMESYYPFLGCIAYMMHLNPELNKHPALERQVINSTLPVVDLPNGVGSKLVLLGDKMPLMSIGSRDWWPGAPDDHARSKLFRRIVSEGHLLPNLLAICIGLVSEIYTTTALRPEDTATALWQATGNRRVRLTYNHSPIADFGIIQGSVRVTNGDRLAYLTPDEDYFQMGQMPEDHYRIYIKTLTGDEYYLDYGMYTFNFCIMVQGTPYCKYGFPDVGMVPAYFMGKQYDKVKVDLMLFKPRKRFSVLRDPRVHSIVRSQLTEFCDCHDAPKIYDIMDEIAGRRCGATERKAMMLFLPNVVKLLRLNMQNREYINFPKEAMVGIDVDPGERGITDDPDGEAEEAYKYLAKQAKKMKKGKISRERWEKAYRNWAAKI